jgi:hypothetical protein
LGFNHQVDQTGALEAVRVSELVSERSRSPIDRDERRSPPIVREREEEDLVAVDYGRERERKR